MFRYDLIICLNTGEPAFKIIILILILYNLRNVHLITTDKNKSGSKFDSKSDSRSDSGIDSRRRCQNLLAGKESVILIVARFSGS